MVSQVYLTTHLVSDFKLVFESAYLLFKLFFFSQSQIQLVVKQLILAIEIVVGSF